MTAPALVDQDDEFLGNHHVYEKYRAGLPKIGPYFRELWRRREFAIEMSKSYIRSKHNDTVFGQLWNVLNPLLLGAIYYLLVVILGGKKPAPEYFPHLLGGLFTFYMVAACMSGGAVSVVSAGKIIMNTAFPRLLLPLATVRTAIYRFLPTMLVFGVVYFASGLRPTRVTLLAIPWFFIIVIFGTGLSFLFAVAQVYFRDTRSFLPYVQRIWLYTSPVLWFANAEPATFEGLKTLEWFNPLYSILGGWSSILIENEKPGLMMTGIALAWAIGTLVVGTLVFMTRERDFAVRI